MWVAPLLKAPWSGPADGSRGRAFRSVGASALGADASAFEARSAPSVTQHPVVEVLSLVHAHPREVSQVLLVREAHFRGPEFLERVDGDIEKPDRDDRIAAAAEHPHGQLRLRDQHRRPDRWLGL